jgi:DNA mismatch repair protein PMS2
MRVIGQFNLGFIIAELDDDLYILDQHACDEKYRFELLQRTTQIHQQPLIAPLHVETSGALELVIADHLEVFALNGFKLSVDPDAPAGRRVKLLSAPFSKSTHFGVDDVNELASMIAESSYYDASGGGGSSSGDATNQRTGKSYLMLKNDFLGPSSGAAVSASSVVDVVTQQSPQGETLSQKAPLPQQQQQQSFKPQYHLPKLVALYASRACRSAIMIGTALREQEMQRIVAKLEGVEQPWNCPHGRPTMRHLVDLSLLLHRREEPGQGQGQGQHQMEQD